MSASTAARVSRVASLAANYRNVAGTRRCQELRMTRNKVPGVVYGGPQNREKILVHTDQLDVARLLRERGQSFNTTLIDLKVEDEYDKNAKEIKSFRVLPRSITLHHLNDYPISCNWMIHDPVKGVKVDLPVFVQDKEKCPGVKRGGMLSRVLWTVPCLVKGEQLVDGIYVSVAGLNVGDRVRWSDIKWETFLPEGTTVECLMFRKPSFMKSKINNLTLITVEGKRGMAKDDENTAEETLDSF